MVKNQKALAGKQLGTHDLMLLTLLDGPPAVTTVTTIAWSQGLVGETLAIGKVMSVDG